MNVTFSSDPLQINLIKTKISNVPSKFSEVLSEHLTSTPSINVLNLKPEAHLQLELA